MITVEEARRHWFDDWESECKQVERARNEVWQWYIAHYFDFDRGRRWRGRLLSWANQQVCNARRACPICTQDVLWESGFVGVSRYKAGST